MYFEIESLDGEDYSMQLEKSHGRPSHNPRNPVRQRGEVLFILSTVLFITSLILSSWSFSRRVWSTEARNKAMQETNAYSPILTDMGLHLSLQRMQGSVVDTSHSIFRQPPSPSVDAAWNNISNLYSIWLRRSEIIQMGKNYRTVAQYPESFGLGPDAYAGELDILHKIHCLNFLRREIHFDYYLRDKYPDGKSSALHKAHTTHCLHMLLQHLMCDANTEIVTKQWVEGQIHPYPDFSINRKCGDFGAVMKWQEERRVPNELFRPWRMPEGFEPVKASEDFKVIFGYADGEMGAGHEYHHD